MNVEKVIIELHDEKYFVHFRASFSEPARQPPQERPRDELNEAIVQHCVDGGANVGGLTGKTYYVGKFRVVDDLLYTEPNDG